MSPKEAKKVLQHKECNKGSSGNRRSCSKRKTSEFVQEGWSVRKEKRWRVLCSRTDNGKWKHKTERLEHKYNRRWDNTTPTTEENILGQHENGRHRKEFQKM